LRRRKVTVVGLVELSEAAFRQYREELSRDYAQDKVRAGVWSAEEAEDRAARELHELLPEGAATKGHFLYAVRDELIQATVVREDGLCHHIRRDVQTAGRG
jgi:hypothetical protein